MAIAQPTASNSFFEPPAESEALPTLARFDGTAGVFTPTITGPAEGIHVNVENNGVFALLDMTDRLFFTESGGILTPTTTGTEEVILVANDDDILVPTTDLEETPTAEQYADGNGRYVVTGRNGSDALQFLAISTTLQPFL